MVSLNGTHTRSIADEAVKASKARGFQLACPSCGKTKVVVTLDLQDLSTCKCSECEDEFSVGAAIKHFADQLDRYQALARWIEMAKDVL